MPKGLMLIILFFINTSLIAQDSLKVYELQPVEFSQKIGNDYWTVQNYFSKIRKLKITFNDAYPIGVGPYSVTSNNYGVKLNTPKNNNTILVKQVYFALSKRDTQNLKSATFYLIKEDSLGKIEKYNIIVKSITLDTFSATKQKFDDILMMTRVEFEIKAFNYNTADKIYFFRQDYIQQNWPSSLVLVDSKKDITYIEKDGKIQKLILKFDVPLKNQEHLTWQTRITYRTYKE